jgi:nucleotide-binding universal stress UspA family protein
MIKSIVAALDGSPESLAGLEQGVVWAERLDAELRAIFVQDDRRFMRFPTYSDSEGAVPKPIPLSGKALKEAEALAAEEEEELRSEYDRLTKGYAAHAELTVVRGAVEHTLIRQAHAADLVVLGKRGRGLDENVGRAGPTTETLIHEALRPVLVVPRNAITGGPVLVPFDGSKGVQRVIVPGVQLVAALGAPVTVLTVSARKDRAEEIQAPLRSYLNAHKVKAEFRIEEGDESERHAAHVILETADHMKVGMIMMGAFSLSPLKEFFVGSVTRNVLNRARCPVLMMS